MNQQNNETKTWHEDDNFWQTFGPEMFTQKHWDVAPEEIEQVVALLDITPPANVLDLCCGPGRHSLELARQGFGVTGVDRTATYLKEANQRAQTENLDINFYKEDMRRFCAPDSFDAVLNMYTAFGYFEDLDEDRQVLANIHRSLKPGGKLILDIIGKEILARIWRDRDWTDENGTIFLQERKVNKNWTQIQVRWLMFKDDKWHETTFSHRLYSAAELSALLTQCGFASVDCYGDLSAAPYDHQAKRLVVVAKK